MVELQFVPLRNVRQTLLFPSSPVGLRAANQLVFFLLDVAAELDLKAIHAPRG